MRMNLRKRLCWLLGHDAEYRLWAPTKDWPASISVPFCKYCDKCLTVLPFEMQVIDSFYKAYKTLPDKYKSLYGNIK